jgi:hypothetical protein
MLIIIESGVAFSSVLGYAFAVGCWRVVEYFFIGWSCEWFGFVLLGCGVFLAVTRRLENHNAFNQKRLILRLFPCAIAYFLHMSYVALCWFLVDEYVALHRKFIRL